MKIPKDYLFFDNCGDCEIVRAASYTEATLDIPEDFLPEWHEVHDLWHIAKMQEDGTWEILGSYWEEEEADDVIDDFCDKYPNSHIDILYGDEVNND
jgi:hypothetical protein